ncbi:SPOSA6832_01004, partial [Sporobolomyces salmonicolor]
MSHHSFGPSPPSLPPVASTSTSPSAALHPVTTATTSTASPSAALPPLAAAEVKPTSFVPLRAGDRPVTIRRSAKACQYCRKGKARCDGLESYPCRRCRCAHGRDYPASDRADRHSRHSRLALRTYSRENGVECVFDGISTQELKRRAERKKDESGGDASSEPVPVSFGLEARLRQIEGELERLRTQTRRHEDRLDRLDGEGSADSDIGSQTPTDRETFDRLAREAFDLSHHSFWEKYAPLAPYISPVTDTYDELRTRSPLLMHCIVAVASRFQENREFVESNRNDALRMMRETLYAGRHITLDDGRGAPPGHSITLALQLDLPKVLLLLVFPAIAVFSSPSWLTRSRANLNDARSLSSTYSQASPSRGTKLAPLSTSSCRLCESGSPFTLKTCGELVLHLFCGQHQLNSTRSLSFAMGRRSMVTIDLSVTNSRLLLNFAALRPVDARLIAQSELVTILGVVQESFLKMQHQTAETVHVVQQANAHLDTWMRTWGDWAISRHLSRFTFYGGRFYTNTLGLRDITNTEELLPIHMPCLRTALDAAVRIQGIHPALKIAHSAEFTLITLSTSALFLLKMIKLTPHAFSPYPSPNYPSFPPPQPDSTPNALDPSSPDASASPTMVSVPSISQALEAVRHSAGLLASAPVQQSSYAQAVEAALRRLEGELAASTAPSPSVDNDGSAGGGSGIVRDKRLRDELDHPFPRPLPPPPPPGPPAASFTFPGGSYYASDAETASAFFSETQGFEKAAAAPGGTGAAAGAGGGAEFADFGELTIASLIGTDSFWSWGSSLPGESIQGIARAGVNGMPACGSGL